MSPQSEGELFHGLNPRAHDLPTPEVEVPAGPSWGVVAPKALEVFFEQISANGLEVIAKQIAQPEFLLGGEIGLTFEDAPARLVQQGFMAVLFHFASLSGPHVVEGLIHFGDEVKAVEDVQGLATIPANHLEVGFPHVGANELDFGGELFAQHSEESLESFYSSFLAHPEQTRGASIDLIDQGEVFVALGILDLVHPDGGDGG